MWLEPQASGEFDVAIGAQVRAADGNNIVLVDDDKQEKQATAGTRYALSPPTSIHFLMPHSLINAFSRVC